jgi:Ni,Fe-hydrogenase III large subunit
LLWATLKDLVPVSQTLVKRLGWWGIVGKASGLNYDARRHRPHGAYPFLDFNLCERKTCDAKARFEVALDEMNLSLDILNQLLSDIPNDPGERPMPKSFTPGYFYGTSESAKGPIISCVEITEQGQVGSVRLFSTSQRVWPVIDHLFTNLRAEDFHLAHASLGIDSEDGEV